MKKIYPKSFVFIIFITMLVFFNLLALYMIVDFSIIENFNGDIKQWLYFIFSILTSIYVSYLIIRIGRRKIILYENKLFVLEDIGYYNLKLQYELEISYINVDSIIIGIDSKNSLNKSLKQVITPMPNIIFKLKNNTMKRINVYYYSKKQIIEIIDFVIARIKLRYPKFNNATGYELVSNMFERKK
ncbi:hypothetical protein ACAG96_01980 [Candidatus Izemoplasma sp. B36]|uniref:hypothetical protein n=1 Tax=Candidatus Izemoplasma sp. B36 TaxID=3242468 RepID=UPI00355718DA